MYYLRLADGAGAKASTDGIGGRGEDAIGQETLAGGAGASRQAEDAGGTDPKIEGLALGASADARYPGVVVASRGREGIFHYE